MAPYRNAVTAWNRMECEGCLFDLTATLTSGQAFRWRRDASGIWWGSVGSTGMALWQRHGDSSAPLYWQTFPESGLRAIVEDYFRLDVPLVNLYTSWSAAEPHMIEAIQAFRGLRILRQPPIECFFAFQCATCNTVVKIERTVHRLATRYGERVGPGSGPDGERTPPTGLNDTPPALTSPSSPTFPIHLFPELDALAEADEADLRADLWGYRAPRVIALARHLQARGPGWLEGLRAVSYADAKTELTALHGIGEKVADCICLFSLDKDEAVPVDTHVRQIACRLFLPELDGKSLTPRIYAAIADAYRERFGVYAGWAQQYLFLGAMRGFHGTKNESMKRPAP